MGTVRLSVRWYGSTGTTHTIFPQYSPARKPIDACRMRSRPECDPFDLADSDETFCVLCVRN
jgi:hypothetical protein